MKKIKLPRKRKKAFIKAKSKEDYSMIRMLNEILSEEGTKFAERFYELRIARTKGERKNGINGYAIVKRW